MRAFVAIRKYISNNLIEQKYINGLVLKDLKRIDVLEQTFENFKEPNDHIFFKGKIYDAYSLLVDILSKAKESIIIIDNYVNKNLLDIISKTNKKVKVITNAKSNIDIEKYLCQYNNLEIVVTSNFHDYLS